MPDIALPPNVIESVRYILSNYRNMNSRADPEYSDRKSAEMVRNLNVVKRGLIDWLSSAFHRDDIMADVSRPIGNWPDIPWISFFTVPSARKGDSPLADSAPLSIDIRFIPLENKMFIGIYPIEKDWQSRYSESWTEEFARHRERLRPRLAHLQSIGLSIPNEEVIKPTFFRKITIASCQLNALAVKEIGVSDQAEVMFVDNLVNLMKVYLALVDQGDATLLEDSEEGLQSTIVPGRIIERIQVTGFLDQFNYSLDFSGLPRVSIVHGPNGMGKTSLFRILDSLHGRRPDILHLTPFQSYKVKYSGGETLEVQRKDGNIVARIIDGSGDTITEPDLQKELDENEKRTLIKIRAFEPYVQLAKSPNSNAYSIVSYVGSAGEPQVLADTRLSPLFQRADTKRGINKPLPMDTIAIRFIDTERLNTKSIVNYPFYSLCGLSGKNSGGIDLTALGKELDSIEAWNPEDEPLELFDVITCSRHMIGLVSFYDEVDFGSNVHEGNREALTELKAALAAYKRAQHDDALKLLRSIETDDLPYTQARSEAWRGERGKISTEGLGRFIQESIRELNAFIRIRTLVEIVNSMLLYKQMRVERSKVSFVSEITGKDIQFESLSSGERNVLMMFYHIILGQEVLEIEGIRGAVFIIDEPEISLHVIWQQAIIRNIIKATSGTNSQVIILTHSPQIVHDRSDLLVELNRSNPMTGEG